LAEFNRQLPTNFTHINESFINKFNHIASTILPIYTEVYRRLIYNSLPVNEFNYVARWLTATYDIKSAKQYCQRSMASIIYPKLKENELFKVTEIDPETANLTLLLNYPFLFGLINQNVALALLEKPDIYIQLSSEKIYQIAKVHTIFAITLLDKPELVTTEVLSKLKIIAEDNEAVALGLLAHHELLKKLLGGFFVGATYRRLAKIHQACAIDLLNIPEILKDLSRYDIGDIIIPHEASALALLEKPKTLKKVKHYDLVNITKKYSRFIPTLLTKPNALSILLPK